MRIADPHRRYASSRPVLTGKVRETAEIIEESALPQAAPQIISSTAAGTVKQREDGPASIEVGKFSLNQSFDKCYSPQVSGIVSILNCLKHLSVDFESLVLPEKCGSALTSDGITDR